MSRSASLGYRFVAWEGLSSLETAVEHQHMVLLAQCPTGVALNSLQGFSWPLPVRWRLPFHLYG